MQHRTSLSAREVSIALMIRHGWSSADIAQSLQLAPETVKSHRRNIRKKLGLTGSHQSLRLYLQVLAMQDNTSHVT
jgi:DNA-binding CsgD family transcriptional regulator